MCVVNALFKTTLSVKIVKVLLLFFFKGQIKQSRYSATLVGKSLNP